MQNLETKPCNGANFTRLFWQENIQFASVWWFRFTSGHTHTSIWDMRSMLTEEILAKNRDFSDQLKVGDIDGANLWRKTWEFG